MNFIYQLHDDHIPRLHCSMLLPLLTHKSKAEEFSIEKKSKPF